MKDSAARQLLDHVWINAQHDPWQRINYAMRDALNLAIRSGMPFNTSDFAHFADKHRWRYWVGSDREWIYSAAIIDSNDSCVAAWEALHGREPFRANDLEASSHQGYLHKHHIRRQRERLFVGASFPLDGRRWFVTAFDDKKGVVRAALYEHNHQTGAPKKLRAFTHDDMRDLFPAPKKAKKQPEKNR